MTPRPPAGRHGAHSRPDRGEIRQAQTVCAPIPSPGGVGISALGRREGCTADGSVRSGQSRRHPDPFRARPAGGDGVRGPRVDGPIDPLGVHRCSRRSNRLGESHVLWAVPAGASRGVPLHRGRTADGRPYEPRGVRGAPRGARGHRASGGGGSRPRACRRLGRRTRGLATCWGTALGGTAEPRLAGRPCAAGCAGTGVGGVCKRRVRIPPVRVHASGRLHPQGHPRGGGPWPPHWWPSRLGRAVPGPPPANRRRRTTGSTAPAP